MSGHIANLSIGKSIDETFGRCRQAPTAAGCAASVCRATSRDPRRCERSQSSTPRPAPPFNSSGVFTDRTSTAYERTGDEGTAIGSSASISPAVDWRGRYCAPGEARPTMCLSGQALDELQYVSRTVASSPTELEARNRSIRHEKVKLRPADAEHLAGLRVAQQERIHRALLVCSSSVPKRIPFEAAFDKDCPI